MALASIYVVRGVRAARKILQRHRILGHGRQSERRSCVGRVRFHIGAQVSQLAPADRLSRPMIADATRPPALGLGRDADAARQACANVQAWRKCGRPSMIWMICIAMRWRNAFQMPCVVSAAGAGPVSRGELGVRLGGFTPMRSACVRRRTPTARLW